MTPARLAGMNANIHDRASIERVYPRDSFARDAGRNTAAEATLHRGIRILSAPDAGGDFALEQASRDVGENARDEAGVFLAPTLVAAGTEAVAPDAAYGAAEGAPAARQAQKTAGYDAFIDDIIAAAKTAGFPDQPPPGDPRLRGLRQ